MFGVFAVITIFGGFSSSSVRASVIPGNDVPFPQQIARDLDRNSDLDFYGFKGIVRQEIPAVPITDCFFTVSQSGRYVYKAVDGTETVCGIYVFTEPDEVVEFSFPHMDVPCNGIDLIGVVDGWELNGQYFPSGSDHHLSLDKRSSEFCGRKNLKTYTSSQNVALVQYRIPTVGKGFVVSIKFRKNLQPCNVVASSLTEPFTLRNFGRRVNCTFVAIYPAVVRIDALDVGSKRLRGTAFPESETGIIHQCDKRGSKDQVQIGGTSGLDTTEVEILDTICGVDSRPTRSSKIIDCEVTTVRLVSTGKYDNAITITAEPADGKEKVDADLTCGLNVIHAAE
ncbi:corticotropin-releasing factor-binding protein [Venturia canescens]|uniref:corticotropin-releasing factor-binding protein n=1 Tax=Venturia canescens TaxID=32260 RepID=UPI001C9CA095|nr:corticotropin-releasing factor-binding protein [Venturia canescens]XP_043275545.1 corticotropin-releasing factor-binding protein [Venturia canescens]XP_043275546.1 corticotropin-releasing factor-binding protein [Venturia canescens]